MKHKRKKYSTGTRVKNYLETPGTELAQNQINMAGAMLESETNPATQMMSLLGNAAIQYGVGQGGFKGVGGMNENMSNLLNGLLQSGGMMAMGGTVPVEVEGEETGILPNGMELDFVGPKHEQGGIDVDLPEGTEIYSDRIKIDGKTMAERQKARSKKRGKIEDLVEKYSADPILESTAERVAETTEGEEEMDMALQEALKQLTEVFAYGGRAKYQGGGVARYGDPNGVQSQLGDTIMRQALSYSGNPFGLVGSVLPMDQVPMAEPTTAVRPPLMAGMQPQQQGNNNIFSKILTNLKNSPLEVPDVTTGDVVSLAGQAMGTFRPMRNTLANRAGDSPNPNYFQDYGEDTIDRLEGSQDYLDDVEAQQLRELNLSRRTAQERNRRGARGINTMRSLDIATDLNADRARREVKAGTAQQKMQLDQAIAQAEAARDQVQMGGAREADISNRQDRDNFYTQRAADIVGQALGFQNIGRSLNQIKQREVIQNLLGSLSKYGITIDEKGNLVTKDK